jgi:formamidopyrimidine-DNA glycosylase
MPELPEVEIAARRLREMAVGRTIRRVTVHHPAHARSMTPAACRALVGRTIMSVNRRAKIQLVTLDDASTIEVHFRMTGDWEFTAPRGRAPAHERVRLVCADGWRISLTDARAFAVMRVHAPGAWREPLLGPEPLEDTFTPALLRTQLAGKRGPIKSVLLDQRVVAGVGNIYASEALWRAEIAPTAVAGTLSSARIARLRDAIVAALAAAPAMRYYGRDVAPTEPSWHVYDRAGDACPRCASSIHRQVIAGRSTYFCRRCQR